MHFFSSLVTLCNENLRKDIFIDNSKITRVTNTTFLIRVIINSRLTPDNHIKTISSKLSKNIGILAKIRHNIPSTTLIQFGQLVLIYL